MLAAARLPILYSDSLLYFCSLLIFHLAGFLLRPIGLYPGNSGLSREIFRASPLRCALVYRHNDIIVLIIGKSNRHPIQLLVLQLVHFSRPHSLWTAMPPSIRFGALARLHLTQILGVHGCISRWSALWCLSSSIPGDRGLFSEIHHQFLWPPF